MKKNKVIFIPALMGGTRSMFTRDIRWKGYTLDSFSDTCIDYYPYLLSSAYYEVDAFDVPHKEALRFRDDLIHMGDSGGFQALKLGIELDVEKNLRWQEDNCDYGMSFDHPPQLKMVGGKLEKTTNSEYIEKMEKTYQNNIRAIENRRHDKPLEIYNVMQGENLERKELWWRKMKNLQFEHIAFGAYPRGNAMIQAFTLCFLHSKGWTGRIHALGVGGLSVLPLYIYVKDWFEVITFDNSTYGQGMRAREYFAYKGKRSVNFGNLASKRLRDEVLKDGLPCLCKTCRLIDKEELPILFEPGSMGGALIASHNVRMFANFVENEEELYDNLGHLGYREHYYHEATHGDKRPELNIAFEFIDDYTKTKDIERTYRKYIRMFSAGRKEPSYAKKLF